MAAQDALFGTYLPERSLLHRLPVGAKYAVVLAGTLPTLLTRQGWLAGAVLLASAGLLLLTRLPVRRTLALPWGYLVLLGLVVAYHAAFGDVGTGVTLAATMTACLYLSRVLTMTTPAPVLVDALVAAARPLERVGVDPERLGLAIGLMLRSVPYVAGLFTDVRDAARARGIERHPLVLLTPAVVAAVAYAHRTGDALTARGLGDPDD